MSADLPFAGERYAVIGLGRNGAPVADALAAMGAKVAVWDDRHETLRQTRHEWLAPPFHLAGYRGLVLSPGIPHRLPAPHPAADAARAARVPILSDAELLYVATRRRQSTARFVGITGTNGKSTTTALLHHMLVSAGWDSAAGGNLGTPALALPALGDGGVYVLEMSSYMLERLQSLRFDVACLLNLSPDHLDRHGDMAGYIAAKRHIFDRQTETDSAIIGIDDPDSEALAASLEGPRLVRISGARPADLWCDQGTLRDADGPILSMADAPALPGEHNAQNAAAAAAMALALGLPRDRLAGGISSFPGLAHRQQRVASIGGIAWINDSKATNADAAARALACYDRIVWILGGQSKAGGIDSLRPYFPRIAHALLIGRDGPRLSGTLRSAGVPFSLSGTLDAAVAAARSLAPRVGAEVVLLSPACASFDQFASFEARGDRFTALALAGLPESS
jgi:UDP-N-acetylmuramoylalanine--D-glutamate ligase